jgi:hypothetical protein
MRIEFNAKGLSGETLRPLRPCTIVTPKPEMTYFSKNNPSFCQEPGKVFLFFSNVFG